MPSLSPGKAVTVSTKAPQPMPAPPASPFAVTVPPLMVTLPTKPFLPPPIAAAFKPPITLTVPLLMVSFERFSLLFPPIPALFSSTLSITRVPLPSIVSDESPVT